MKHRESLRRGLGILGVKAATYLAGGLTSVMVARLLNPHQRGLWAIALFLLGLVAILSEFGLGVSAARQLQRKGVAQATLLATTLGTAAGLGCAGVALAAMVILTWGGSLFPGVPISLLLITSSAAVLVVLTSVARQQMLVLGDFTAHNSVLLLQALSAPAVVLVVLGVLKGGLHFLAAAYAASLALTCVAAVLWLGHRHLGGGPSWDPTLLRPLLGDAARAHWATVALFLSYRVDLLIVNLFAGPAATGVYAVALSLSEILRGIPESAQTIVMARLRETDLEPTATTAARLGTLLTVIAGLVLAVLSTWMVPWVFGAPYVGAAAAFALLVPGVSFLALSYALAPMLLRAGRLGVSARAATLGAVVMVAVDLLLVPRFGIKGAAVGSSLAYGTIMVVQVADLLRRGDIDAGSLVRWQRRARAARECEPGEP